MDPEIYTNLQLVLAKLYLDESNIRRVIKDAGINLARIDFTSSALDIWASVFTEAEKVKRIDPLLEVVKREYSDNEEFDNVYTTYRQFAHLALHDHTNNQAASKEVAIEVEASKRKMTEPRLSIFVSHKLTEKYKRAAKCIKTVLEARTERLDIHICEDMVAGDLWRKWINDEIMQAQGMLILWPHEHVDSAWIAEEVARFRSYHPERRLIVLKHPSDPVPDFLRELLIIDALPERLHEQFLRPLYWTTRFLNIEAPLNARVTEVDIAHDAYKIANALAGIVDPLSMYLSESLVVETAGLDLNAPAGLDNALVHAPNGCSQILNLHLCSFTWSQLRARASENKGKGTFWVAEMEAVIGEVARHQNPSVMTSTFRGRGETLGRIFRPLLNQVDFVDEAPVRYYFVFHEVLVPELVRGAGPIGDVFNLLYHATRVRWEVLNPFLVKQLFHKDDPPATLGMSQEEQDELIGRVKGSMRTIELEVERHNLLDTAVKAFDDEEQGLIINMLKKREEIKNALDQAIAQKNYAQLLEELKHGLELNSQATEILAIRFLQLVREDHQRVQHLLHKGQPGLTVD